MFIQADTGPLRIEGKTKLLLQEVGEMTFTLVENENYAKIKVIGVGGAGGNAINNMIDSELRGVNLSPPTQIPKPLKSQRHLSNFRSVSSLPRGLGPAPILKSAGKRRWKMRKP